MAAPSTELNTSTASNITFAASPEPQKSEDIAALLQLELVDQIKEYNEQKTAKSKSKITKKAYRSEKRDIALEEIAYLSPEEQLRVLLEHHRLTGHTKPAVQDLDDEDDVTMPSLMNDEQTMVPTSSSNTLGTRVRHRIDILGHAISARRKTLNNYYRNAQSATTGHACYISGHGTNRSSAQTVPTQRIPECQHLDDR